MVFFERDMKLFMILLKCMLIVLRLCYFKKGELILSETSNHTIKLMTISILYYLSTHWFLLVNFHAEFHTNWTSRLKIPDVNKLLLMRFVELPFYWLWLVVFQWYIWLLKQPHYIIGKVLRLLKIICFLKKSCLYCIKESFLLFSV